MLPAKRSILSISLTRPRVHGEAFDPQIQDPRVREGLKFLCQDKTPRLNEVASRLNLSTSRFRHLFKKEVGISPKHYVLLLRLQWAKNLLENSHLQVKEVTAAVGVNDVSHFVRSYKAVYQQTPSQARGLGLDGSGSKSPSAVSAKK